MKRNPRDRTPAPVWAVRSTLFALSLFVGASCVSRARYEEAQEEIRYYQRAWQDQESFTGKLEADNERLKGELELYRGNTTIEAAATADIDERLEQLQGMMDALGVLSSEVTLLAVEGGYGLRLTDAVLFDSGSAEIKPDGRALLVQMAKEITARPFERIWVRGHTDSDPVVRAETKERFPRGNLELSLRRALEVAGLLVDEGGVAKERVVVAGFGPSDPIAPNTSAEGKSKNRRVDIYVIQDAGAAADR